MLAVSWNPATATSAMRSVEAAFLYGVEGATTIWLVRHGDCYESLGDGTNGRVEDPPLSPVGEEQVRRLAERMSRVRVDAVYSSPLRRAADTARAFSAEVRLEPRLVEVEVDTSSGHVQLIEPLEQVVERMAAAVSDAVAAHPGQRIVMVGHGVAILVYVCDVLRLEYGQLRLLPYYTSVNVIRILGDRRMVGALADTSHLDD
jgi:probable phosphoglycerate mutase